MAKIRNNNISGKLGDKIYSSWHGRPYVRRMPESVANPRTEAQQAHRNAFAAVSKLSSAMKEGHAEGLHWKAVRKKSNTHSVFRNLNKDCFGPEGIDYSCVKISYGISIWECRNCGHIIIGTEAPDVCPVCFHPQAYFEINAENY